MCFALPKFLGNLIPYFRHSKAGFSLTLSLHLASRILAAPKVEKATTPTTAFYRKLWFINPGGVKSSISKQNKVPQNDPVQLGDRLFH